MPFLQTTFSLIAPPVANFLAKDPMVEQYDLSHWRMPLSGAAPLSKPLSEAVVNRLGISGLKQGQFQSIYGFVNIDLLKHM